MSGRRDGPGAREDATVRRTRLGLAGLLGSMAALHVAAPRAFEAMIPRWLPGSRRGWNLAATAAEATSAGLLARPRTARAGGWAALVTFLGVWVANIEAARAGGYRGAPEPLDGPTVAWLRVPLQLPLLRWAWRVANASPTAADRAAPDDGGR